MAQMAGVSRALVSYVLNDVAGHSIPESTRKRVLEAAAQLRYRPSAAGRALRTGRSNLVLVVHHAGRNSPVFSEFMSILSQELAESGLVLLQHPHAPSTLPLTSIWRTINPDAVLAFIPVSEDDILAMHAIGIEVALAFSSSHPAKPWEVDLGHHIIGHAQADHLLELGHRHIGVAFPAGLDGTALADQRTAAVAERVLAAGGSITTRPLDTGDKAAVTGLLDSWLNDAPGMTAVAAFDDPTAAHVLTAAAHLGIAVPDRLAVIGAYDDPWAVLTQPMLTSVHLDVRSRAREVSRAIAAVIAGGDLQLDAADAAPVSVVRRRST